MFKRTDMEIAMPVRMLEVAFVMKVSAAGDVAGCEGVGGRRTFNGLLNKTPCRA